MALAKYFVVFNQKALPHRKEPEQTFQKGKLLEQEPKSFHQSAEFVELEAESEEEAREITAEAFPASNQKVVVVKSSNWNN